MYGPIAIYLGHRDTVDAYRVRQDAVWNREREATVRSGSPVVACLRAEAATAGRSDGAADRAEATGCLVAKAVPAVVCAESERPAKNLFARG
jgi:hypothetical protein